MTTSNAIDIHTRMAPGPPCRHCNVTIADQVFRTVTDECWSLDHRPEAMTPAEHYDLLLSDNAARFLGETA